MKFESRVFLIWLLTTINTLNAVVKFFNSVKLDTFAKSRDIACDVTFWLPVWIKHRKCWFCTLEPVLTDFFLYSFSTFYVVPLHTLLLAIVAVVITKIHYVTHWCTLFNCLSRKQASQNVCRWDQNVWVSKCLCPCGLCVSKCLFKTKSYKRSKTAILTTTLSAERTLHASGKNYAIKTILAKKISERNLLDH